MPSATAKTGASLNLGLIGHWKLNNNYNDSSSFYKHGVAIYDDPYLIAHYKFNGDSTDSAGTNDGTTDTDISWVTGKINQAASFNGTSSNIDIPNSSIFNLASTSFTLAAWVYVASGSSGRRTIFSRATTGSKKGYRFDIESDGTFAIGLGDSSNFTYFKSDQVVGTDAWHHIAITKLTTTLRFYYDGAQDKVITTGVPSTFTEDERSSDIGSHFGSGEFFEGYIDDLRICNDDLRLKSIKDIYNEGNGYENDPPGFVAGKINQAHQFDGLGFSIQIDPFTLPDNNRMTFCFWAQTDRDMTGHGTYSIIGDPSQVVGTPTGFFWIFASYNAITLNYADGVGGQYGTNLAWPGTITDTDWHHYVIVVDWENLTGELFIDGSSESEEALVATAKKPETDGKDIYIGAYRDDVWHKWTGKLDDVRIYNRLLSTAEVTELYNSGTGTETSNLVAGVNPFPIRVSANHGESTSVSSSVIVNNVTAQVS